MRLLCAQGCLSSFPFRWCHCAFCQHCSGLLHRVRHHFQSPFRCDRRRDRYSRGKPWLPFISSPPYPFSFILLPYYSCNLNVGGRTCRNRGRGHGYAQHSYSRVSAHATNMTELPMHKLVLVIILVTQFHHSSRSTQAIQWGINESSPNSRTGGRSRQLQTDMDISGGADCRCCHRSCGLHSCEAEGRRWRDAATELPPLNGGFSAACFQVITINSGKRRVGLCFQYITGLCRSGRDIKFALCKSILQWL